MKTKKFDAVQMKWRGAAVVQKQTATLNRSQELQYWQERSLRLQERQKALQTSAATPVVMA